MQTDAVHYCPLTPNIVGCYILHPSAHPVAFWCVLWGVVASVCTPMQHRRNNMQHCCRDNVGSCCIPLHLAFGKWELTQYKLKLGVIFTLRSNIKTSYMKHDHQ